MNVRVGSFLLMILLVGGLASAEPIPLIMDGWDSGWSVELPDNLHSGLWIDRITSTYVRIEIAKTFPSGPQGGQFPANEIHFYQRLADADTVPTIQITDEIVTNDTGRDWTDYHWEVVGPDAAFDRTATEDSGFSTAPFTRFLWGAPPAGWSSDHSGSLDVDGGGVVHDGETFFPGLLAGKLYIDTDLTEEEEVHFVLRQYPTPEPGTAVLLGVAGVGLLVRRRRPRAAS